MTKKTTSLERARRKAKLHKAKLARMAGVSRSHYGRIEAGDARASFLVARSIASVLGNSVTALQIMELGPEPEPRKQGVKAKEAA